MNDPQSLPRARFLATLEIVHREGRHLAYSWQRLFAEPIAADWVRGLDERPEQAERLEAFVSRFGRMQDTLGEKLQPRWLMALAERPGSLIETLNLDRMNIQIGELPDRLDMPHASADH